MDKIPAGVISANLEDLNSGKIWPLIQKPNSGCHFSSERFEYGSFEIGFRVDWTDKKDNDDPCLDADFYPPGSTKPDKSMRVYPAHHTRKAMDSATRQWVYNFVYGECRLRFLLTLTHEATITAKARIIAAESVGD